MYDPDQLLCQELILQVNRSTIGNSIPPPLYLIMFSDSAWSLRRTIDDASVESLRYEKGIENLVDLISV